MGIAALGLAVVLLGSLAWTGHAAATPESLGYVHLTADSLHLIAAGTWIGALVPLAMLLTNCESSQNSIPAARESVRRFSILGVASVATLVVSGIANSWILVGNLRDLIVTNYGRLLLLKVALFLVMVFLAGINRIVLTPGLAREPSSAAVALRQIRMNTLIEAGLGILVIVLVGALGTLSPHPED
jgi:copper resistance protein D